MTPDPTPDPTKPRRKPSPPRARENLIPTPSNLTRVLRAAGFYKCEYAPSRIGRERFTSALRPGFVVSEQRDARTDAPVMTVSYSNGHGSGLDSVARKFVIDEKEAAIVEALRVRFRVERRNVRAYSYRQTQETRAVWAVFANDDPGPDHLPDAPAGPKKEIRL